MGICPRCGKKQLVSSGLCSQCKEAVASEKQRSNIDSIKKGFPGYFDKVMWDTVSARFGISKPTDKDWSMINDLIRADRDGFLYLIDGITAEKFACGSQYNLKTKKLEHLYANWENILRDTGYPPMFNYVDGRARDMNACVRQALRKVQIYCDAEIAIRAGRYEDAARSYEKLTMYEEAGRIRKMALSERNTSRNVSVNMNQLIDQERQGGLALAYKCPNCGGSININKDFDPGMRVCAYCGTPLDTTVIATMIKNI